MTLIRFFLFFILFWIIIKAIKFLIRAFTTPRNDNQKPKVNNTSQKKYEINKKDIIEAEFEEIKESSADNTNSN